MAWQWTPYSVPLALATLLATVIAAYVWRQRDSKAETWGVAVQLSIALWAGVQLLALSSTSLDWKLFWFRLLPLSIAVLTVSLLSFTLHYTGRGGWLTRRRLGGLLAFPVAALLLSATGGIHDLVFVDPRLDTTGSYHRLAYSLGPGFYAIAVIGYAISAVYAGLLFLKVLRSRNVYRAISVVLLVSVVLLAGLTLVSLAGLSPFPHFLLLPFTFLFVGAVLLLTTLSTPFVRRLPIDRLIGLASGGRGDVEALARDFVVEEIDNGIIVLDTDGRVVDINSTAKTMIGAERAVGRPIRDIIASDRIVDAGALDAVLSGEDAVDELHEEVWVDTPSGERCYDVTISTLTGGDGAAGRVVLLHDLTAQKRRQEALQERELELERQKESLETQTTQLEHQNERLDRFAGIVSHDLRNPLNVGQGHIETVREDLDEDGTVVVDAATVEAIDASLERMGDIIDDALTLARQGKAITDPQAVCLSNAAEEAWGNVDTVDGTLVVESDREIQADRDRLLTLLENLFRNAVEHGGPGVTVHVGDRLAGFYVEDDGQGIPDAEKAAVLEHGFTTNVDGTGFGLSIVSDVAGAHGWTVDVTDGSDGGARFELSGVTTPDGDA